jgi:hypothetical protein
MAVRERTVSPIVLALGVNLWIVTDALPLLLAAKDEPHWLWLLLLSSPALIALAAGAWLRSAAALFVIVPLFIVVPSCLAGAEASARVLPMLALVPQALSLAAYLLAVAHALSTDAPADVPPSATRRLRQDPLPERWKRRLRVYRGLAATAIGFPLVLIAAIDLSPELTRQLSSSFGPHAPRMQALITVAAALLSVGVWRAYLVAPLQAHLQHDRDLAAAAEADRAHARRGRPRPAFYLAVAVALLAMGAVVWQRAK